MSKFIVFNVTLGLVSFGIRS